ncbi:MAG: hypothetical protein HLX50_07555 [Alteromonadaceae bacterium]|nr:hypothetical protein [Alteromonadaceae bacterium]
MSVEEDLLPESMAELVDIIGLPAVLKLMEARGGTEFWVPERITHQHPLVDDIGTEAAQTMSEYMPLERIKVPRGAAIRREIRNRAIRRERFEGAKLAELALRYGMTDRQVLNILNSEPEDDRQQDMFG